MSPLSKAQIKWLRSLQLKKFREAEGLFVVEGEKMVLEGLAAKEMKLEMLISAADYELKATFPPERHFTANTTQLEQISTLKTPNKLVAVFRQSTLPFPDKGLIIALDDVQDPGNMGTILRLADWFGATGILCSPNTVDCYNPKVVQASMGAIFRIPVNYCNLPEKLTELKLPVYGALLYGDNYSKVTYPEDLVVLMGNEGNGISESVKNTISQAVTIPRFGEAESLNVAMATAILLAEIKR